MIMEVKELHLESCSRYCQGKVETNCRYLCENFIKKAAYIAREKHAEQSGLRLMKAHVIATELRPRSQFSRNWKAIFCYN